MDVLLLDSDHASVRLQRPDGGFEIHTRTYAGSEANSMQGEIVDLAGRSKLPLTLALGAGWVATTTLDLPPMPRKELALVLARRAAKLANLQPDDVHFAARCLGPAPQLEQESKEQRHLLAVCSRARIEPLRRELARRGRKVVHVLPARLARLSFACQQLTSHPSFAAQSSAIVIDVESRAVITSLVSGTLLLSQTVLDGDLESVPTLPLAMLQEIKNLEAFHRKARRGVGVACVIVIGLARERAQLFGAAVSAALPDVAVLFDPPLQSSESGADLRSVSLQAAAHDGPFSLDLRAALPLSNRDRGVLAGAATLAVLGLAAGFVRGFSGDAKRAQSERERAERLSADMNSLAERERAAESTVAELESQVARLSAVAGIGFDPGWVLARLGSCLPPDLLPWSFSVSAPELGGQVNIAGRVAAEPLRAFRSLELLRTGLDRLPEIETVQVEPQSVLESGEDERTGLEFELRATLVRGSP